MITITDNEVIIRIDGDNAGFINKMKDSGTSSAAIAAKLADEYKKAGMSAEDAMRKASNEVKKAGNETEVASGKVKNMANAFGLASAAFQLGAGLIKSAVKGTADAVGAAIQTALNYNSQMEQYQTSFGTLLGDQEKAVVHIDELKKMAAETPFEMTDLAGVSELLLSFGTSVDQIKPSLKRLGDISLGNSEKFKGLALAFAQVKSQGRLMGQDLLQMVNQGFNPLQIISEKTGKSMAELMDEMSRGAISFDLVEDAMKSATSEGGRFNNAMENASKTYEGMVSTLKDNAKQKLGDLFSDISNILRNDVLPALIDFVDGIDTKKIVNNLKAAIQVFKEFTPLIWGTVTAMAAYKTALTVITAVKALNKVISDATTISSLYSQGFTIAQMANVKFGGSATVLGTIIALLTGKLKLAELATYALAAAKKLLTGPAGFALIASLAIGAAVAIFKFVQNNDKAAKQLRETKKAIDDINKSYENSIDQINDTLDAETKNILIVDKLKDKIYELDNSVKSGTLSDKESKKAKDDLKAAVKELKEYLPELSVEFDTQTGFIKTQRTEIDNLITGYKNLLQTQAIYNARKSQLDAQALKVQGLREKEEELKKTDVECKAGETYHSVPYPDVMRKALPPDRQNELVWNAIRQSYDFKPTKDYYGSAYDAAYSAVRAAESEFDRLTDLLIEDLNALNNAKDEYQSDGTGKQSSSDTRSNDKNRELYGAKEDAQAKVVDLENKARYGEATEEEVITAKRHYLPFLKEEDDDYIATRADIYNYDKKLAEQNELDKLAAEKDAEHAKGESAKDAERAKAESAKDAERAKAESAKDAEHAKAESAKDAIEQNKEAYDNWLKYYDGRRDQEKKDLEYQQAIGYISDQEYYEKLAAHRDKYYAVGTAEHNAYTIDIKKYNDSVIADQEKAWLYYYNGERDRRFKDLEYNHNMGYITEEEYYKQLAVLRDMYYAKGTEEYHAFTEKIQGYQLGLFNDAVAAVKQKADDIIGTYTQCLSDLEKKRDEFSRKFDLSASDMFKEETAVIGRRFVKNSEGTGFEWQDVTASKTLLTDANGIAKKTKAMTKYGDLLDKIKEKGNVPEQMFNEIMEMGVEQGTKAMEAVLALSDVEYQSIMSAYGEYYQKQKELSDEYISEEVKTLKEKLETELGQTLPEDFFTFGGESGKQFAEAFLAAFNDMMSGIKTTVQSSFSALDLPSASGSGDTKRVPEVNIINNNTVIAAEGESTQKQLKMLNDNNVKNSLFRQYVWQGVF